MSSVYRFVESFGLDIQPFFPTEDLSFQCISSKIITPFKSIFESFGSTVRDSIFESSGSTTVSDSVFESSGSTTVGESNF